MKSNLSLILIIVVLLIALLPASVVAAPVPGPLAGWKWISGPLMPGSHSHGFFVHHLWVGDGWTGATYTCSVNLRTYQAARRNGWANCLGKYGRW